MTIDQVCGWEHGVLSGEGGGTVTSITGTGMSIDSTVQRSGSFCLKGNGSGGETIANTASPVNNSTTISGSFYFKWNILSNVITSVCRIYTAAGSTARINFDPSDQKIFGRYVSNGPKVDLVLEQDVWYRIDYKADVSDNPNKLWYNVNAVGEQYTEYAQSATNFTSTVYGMIESTPTITQGIYYWDDCLASDDMNDYPIGAHMVAGLSPVTNSPTSNPGTVIKDTGGTLVDDGTNPAYVELDDTPPLTSTADYRTEREIIMLRFHLSLCLLAVLSLLRLICPIHPLALPPTMGSSGLEIAMVKRPLFLMAICRSLLCLMSIR